MAKLTMQMIRNALDAFVRKDAALARQVLESDDAVDSLRDDCYMTLVRFMEADPRRIASGVHHIFVARNLERLADHATNIAEDVVFLIEAVDVRHHATLRG
jgi:phosphate transport system protein